MELNYGLTLNPQRAEKIKPIILSFLSSDTMKLGEQGKLRELGEILAV